MKYFLVLFGFLFLASCSENYSNGERIGMVTQFSKTGIFFKSYEGHLNVTQTGMNSSVPFDFSIDNDKEDPLVIATLDSAANYGWKVKLIYHETMGWNWFNNRGETNHFITEVRVLDKGVTNPFSKQETTHNSGIVRDTVYVVIFRDKK
jgi:hypothetical protein